MREAANPTRQISAALLYALSALVLCVVLYVRIRLLALPLERDEGEYAYMGQLLLKGIKPFTLAYSMKPPGMSVAYAFFMLLFGQSATAIHLGLLIVNLLSVCLVYLLARRLFNHAAALVSASTYAMLSLSQSVLGVSAHATHFVMLFVLAGYLLLLRAVDKKIPALYFPSGFFLGLALVMKQHAVFFIIFAVLYVAWCGLKRRFPEKKSILAGSSLLVLGACVPYAFIIIAMIQAGSINKFWLWTVLYAREYVSETTLSEGLLQFSRQFSPLIYRQLPLWLISAAGLFFIGTRRGGEEGADRAFIAGLLIFSFLSVCPGLYFREHYFVMLLPAIALLAGAAAHFGLPRLSSTLPAPLAQPVFIGLFIVSFLYGMVNEREYLFTGSPPEVSRTIFKKNPFPEALQIAGYLKDNTSANDRILVMGSEPEIYFYADRLSATGHIYMYSLMENHRFARQMQLEMIREIEGAPPAYVVMVRINTSWGGKPDSSLIILKWGERFLEEQYERVGVIDIIGPSGTRYLWGDASRGYMPASDKHITVHKRKAFYGGSQSTP